MGLTEEQKASYIKLENAIAKKEDITDLLEQLSLFDRISIFKTNGTKIKCIDEEKDTKSIV